ncbi:ATP-grasp domain-containing protein [Aeromicrobium massiliense]|uniref:ATP-grasp domain-containing protein n=1 Tax=Aeromicrobium massiliense TaxID=1464554 RepID=UPI00031071EF|nr:hypothetical protein [Aeromicrobium massiliense]
MTIALATALPFRDIDPDLPLLHAAAERRGLAVETVLWDDPAVDWVGYDVVVVRSCWDYTVRREEFLAWAATVPRLANPVEVLRWNTDKTYLRELASAGVPVVETQWDVRSGDPLAGEGEPDAEWVVKPSISAGSRDTARWSDPADVHRHSEELLARGRTSMTQRYVPSVDTDGETAMLFLGGHFSHAIRKAPLLERGEGVNDHRDSRGDITPRAPTAAQLEVAASTHDALRGLFGPDLDLLYARIDLVTAPDGGPVVLEVELTEPSLFLPQSGGGEDVLLDAIEQRVRG